MKKTFSILKIILIFVLLYTTLDAIQYAGEIEHKLELQRYSTKFFRYKFLDCNTAQWHYIDSTNKSIKPKRKHK